MRDSPGRGLRPAAQLGGLERVRRRKYGLVRIGPPEPVRCWGWRHGQGHRGAALAAQVPVQASIQAPFGLDSRPFSLDAPGSRRRISLDAGVMGWLLSTMAPAMRIPGQLSLRMCSNAGGGVRINSVEKVLGRAEKILMAARFSALAIPL